MYEMKYIYEYPRRIRPLGIVLSLVFVFLFCDIPTSTGQNKTINGIVTDAQDNSPLSGVTVRVKGTNVGTTTDENGKFSIFAGSEDTLSFTFLSYADKELRVGQTTHFTVQLTKSYSKLDQVVVIGYGQMKKSDLSSAQVTVTSDQIDRTINTSLDQALQGRAAGVYVSSSSGQPGAAPSVVIRGMGTLTQSSQPLYVVDGVQIKPSDVSDDPNNHPDGFSNILSTISPDDIKTINVLKGPSATAIYGAAGGNGVVIITTKSGQAGQTKISVSSLLTVQDKPKHISLMNLREYAAFRNEKEKAGGLATLPQFADPSVLGDGSDWQKALYQRSLLQKDRFSLSGGNTKTQFYLSGEYFDQQGVTPGSGFKRYSVRLNVDNQTQKWLKIGAHTNVGYTREKMNTTTGGVIEMALKQNPSVPVRNPDGSWGGPITKQFQFTNPVMIASIYNDYNKRLAFIGNVYADITPVKGLTIHNAVNTSIEYFNYYSYHPGYTAGGFVVPQTAAESERRGTNNYWWSVNNRIKYHFVLGGKHDFNVMVAHEAQSWAYESLSGGRTGFISNNVEELSGGDASDISNVRNNSSKSSGAQESYFGRLNYIYNNKYILQATYRADGSSSFGANNKWGFFPSLSLAWRISQEHFMESLSAIDDLKLRFGIGESGNAGGAGGIYASLQAVPTPWGTGFLSQRFPNPNLKWETDKTINVGFDLHMFNSRLEVIADAYVKKSENLITTNTYPFSLGGDIAYSPGYVQWPTVNAGSIKNKGLDLTINTVNIDKKLNWRTGITFSLNRNKITSLLNTINASWNTSQVQFVSKEGQPVSMITGYIAEGLFKDAEDIADHAIQTSNGTLTIAPTGTWPGDIKFKDLNDDGVIDEKDRKVIGNPWPKFTFGFNNSFSYHHFSLNIFTQGSVGNDLVNYPRYENEIPGNSGTYGNYYKSVSHFARPSSYSESQKNTVTLTNPGYHIPRVSPDDQNGNNRMSQWFLEDGSYLRIKNVTLSYDFPRKWISHLAMSSLKASLSVQNLLTITSYSGYDPEVGMVNYGGTMMNGVDTGRYPSVRMYSVSLSASF